MGQLSQKTITLKRVVVTGIGLLTPVGNNRDENWQSISSGRSGTGLITRFDTADYSSKVAGEVKNFNAQDFIDAKEIRRMDPYIHYALAAADEAVRDAGLVHDKLDRERCGVYIGSGIGGIQSIEQNKVILLESGVKRVSPFFLPAAIANMATGHVSIRNGFKGPNLANCTACASSTHSIGDSFRIIQRGEADIMLAGGSEYPITPLGVAGFNVMRAISTRNDQPEKASRPFDRERDGFVIAEGAAILVLEDLEHAIRRGAKVYAEIIGYGFTGDAFHMTAPDPEGDGGFRSMRNALNDAGLKPEDIQYINAHGTSTPLNDKLETKAIKRLFGEQAYKLAVSSTKSMTGHMLGAAGGAEAAFTILALTNSFLPPTINHENRDEECDLDYVVNQGRSCEIENALSNSFGFGGTNGSLIFRKFSN